MGSVMREWSGRPTPAVRENYTVALGVCIAECDTRDDCLLGGWLGTVQCSGNDCVIP